MNNMCRSKKKTIVTGLYLFIFVIGCAAQPSDMSIVVSQMESEEKETHDSVLEILSTGLQSFITLLWYCILSLIDTIFYCLTQLVIFLFVIIDVVVRFPFLIPKFVIVIITVVLDTLVYLVLDCLLFLVKEAVVLLVWIVNQLIVLAIDFLFKFLILCTSMIFNIIHWYFLAIMYILYNAIHPTIALILSCSKTVFYVFFVTKALWHALSGNHENIAHFWNSGPFTQLSYCFAVFIISNISEILVYPLINLIYFALVIFITFGFLSLAVHVIQETSLSFADINIFINAYQMLQNNFFRYIWNRNTRTLVLRRNYGEHLFTWFRLLTSRYLHRLQILGEPAQTSTHETGAQLEDSLDDECVICFERTHMVTIFPCRHDKFCEMCIRRVWESNNLCPLCRSYISSVTI